MLTSILDLNIKFLTYSFLLITSENATKLSSHSTSKQTFEYGKHTKGDPISSAPQTYSTVKQKAVTCLKGERKTTS